MVLGPVERRVGDVVERLAVAPVLGEDRQADADRDRLAVRKLGGGQLLVDAVEQVVGRPRRVARQERGELLAADAVGAAVAALLAQHVGDEAQHGVADGVAEAVVDVLERVEIDQRERHEPVLLGGRLELAAQVDLERAVVAERRQAVRLGVTDGEHGTVGRAQVEREREHRAGQEQLERRIDLPQRHGQRRDEGHDQEGRAGVADIAPLYLPQRHAGRKRDGDGDQGDVRDDVGGAAGEGEDGQPGGVGGADRAAVPAEQEGGQCGGERRQRVGGRVERAPQRQSALGVLDDGGRDEGGDHRVLPPEQDLGGEQEHECERDLARTVLVQRHRLELRRQRGERKHENARQGVLGGRGCDRGQDRPDCHRYRHGDDRDHVPEQSGRQGVVQRSGGGHGGSVPLSAGAGTPVRSTPALEPATTSGFRRRRRSRTRRSHPGPGRRAGRDSST